MNFEEWIEKSFPNKVEILLGEERRKTVMWQLTTIIIIITIMIITI